MKSLAALGVVVVAVTTTVGIDRFRDADAETADSCRVERADSAAAAELVLIGDCAYLPGSYVDLASAW